MFRLLCLVMVTWTGVLNAQPKAEMLHFTEDGTPNGAPLLPGFPMDSVWNGMGQAADGTLYIAVSNHISDAGNVAIFALDPGASAMRLVGDLKSVSEAAGNWEEGETQYKVHTFMPHHGDGRIYFATMPNATPEAERGAHLYALDPATDEITDLSASAPFTMLRDGTFVEGTGVTFAGQGIKGIGLNAAVPDVLYLMSHDLGHLVGYALDTGEMTHIGQSARVGFIFHVDAEGDVYYLGGPSGAVQDFMVWDAQTGETTALVQGIDADEEVGMIVETANPDLIMVLLAASKEVFPVNTATERRLLGGTSCGTNWWRLFNMAASPDGTSLYFVSNNNDAAKVWRVPLAGGECEEVMSIADLIGTRNLAFGGQNLWVDGAFYTPVWTLNNVGDLVLLRVEVE